MVLCNLQFDVQTDLLYMFLFDIFFVHLSKAVLIGRLRKLKYGIKRVMFSCSTQHSFTKTLLNLSKTVNTH